MATGRTRTRRNQMEIGPKTSVFSSVDELAVQIGISRHACYQAIKRGLIPHIRIGRRIILPKTAIAEWLRTAGSPVLLDH